jgi:hypothetical protein
MNLTHILIAAGLILGTCGAAYASPALTPGMEQVAKTTCAELVAEFKAMHDAHAVPTPLLDAAGPDAFGAQLEQSCIEGMRRQLEAK